MKKIIALLLLVNCISCANGQLLYSKKKYQEAISEKVDSIKKLKDEFKQEIEKLEKEKTTLAENNTSALSILKEMNSTWFFKKIDTVYTKENLENYKFQESTYESFKKNNIMLTSLSADASLSASKPLFDKAKKFNEIYFD